MTRPWLWGIIAADALGLAALAFVFPNAMLSPGPLVPAHAELSAECFSCHSPFRGASSGRCITCHALADIGVRTTTGAPVAREAGRATSVSFHSQLRHQDCTACHSEHDKPAPPKFSHELLQPAVQQRCETCHTPPANEVHRTLAVGCGTCHTTARWSLATFDHSLLPRGTLDRCESCHRAPTDAFHRQSPGPCASCHGPARWKPSTFDHSRFFLLDRDHDAACATCHTGNDFKVYTCYGCHEHTPAKIRSEHEEEGITDFENCVRCHRSADDEEEEGTGYEKSGKKKGEHRE